ncbi:CocE/NonD family hydrolase [Mycobacterium spongiae]|uniref:CocE/NonD family hydrolase n=1 Tax=Mycobacterium spongiae TaxID=886343 RepID=A0A975JY85_9MYCO|nr:CocE/NonD family hydrolase [Mycobacterium spongiae]QUR67593.1 CocE/NonD family hydrolase [Mycobacterium spongiae]
MAYSGSDAAWYPPQPPEPRRPKYRGMRYSSCYVTMRDGVRIAIDLYLPAGLTNGVRVPAILHQTRYYRSMQLRWPLRMVFAGLPFQHIAGDKRRRRRFVAGGYAWVDVDVRGSGASYGARVCEWSPDEIRDGAHIVDWIVRQPWCNGKVAALGNSYDGTAAELLLVNQHPAVEVIAPCFALFDAFTDIAFPGGIHATWFTETWGRYNEALDRNALHEVVGWWAKLPLTGVAPVQGDRDRSLRAEAIAAHRDNYDVHEQALSLTFRDDIAPSDPYHRQLGSGFEPIGAPIDESGSINLISPHNYWHDIEASGAAVYSYSGWFDGGYAHSAVKRFLTLSNSGSRLTLGPWNHTGGWHVDPLRGLSKPGFDHDGELLRFCDYHLRGRDTGIGSEPPVHYFTMVEDRWKSADSWPPPATMQSYYFAPARQLSLDAPDSDAGADDYVVDRTAGTGEHSRWRAQVGIGGHVRYPDRNIQDAKLLTYTSAPLRHPVEVTGHPVVTLFVTSTTSDGTFFVYLEDVDERGHVVYITEGQLRAINRRLSEAPPRYRQPVPYRTFKRSDAQALVAGEIAELTFDLLPTSYLFQPGHQIRVAIAGADASHFAILPGGPPVLHVHRSRLRASRVDLPVVRR